MLERKNISLRTNFYHILCKFKFDQLRNRNVFNKLLPESLDFLELAKSTDRDHRFCLRSVAIFAEETDDRLLGKCRSECRSSVER